MHFSNSHIVYIFQKMKIKMDINNNVVVNDVTIHINNIVSMIDTKLVSILQGDSGAPCHYCHCTWTGMNNLLNILSGFSITKSFDTCMDTWKKVESGKIPWRSAERSGQCHKPLVEIKFFAILHWKLRVFYTLLLIYYRLIASVYFWGESDKQLLDLVLIAK